MTIRQDRINQIAETIIKSQLQQGIVPEATNTINQIAEYINHTNLDLPSFSFGPVASHTTVSSDHYIQMLDQLECDLDILYANVIKLANQLNTNFIKYDREYSKLEYEIAALTSTLKTNILKCNTTGILYSTYDNFIDMSKIDTSATDASVDIDKHCVTITTSNTTPTKINMGNPDTYTYGATGIGDYKSQSNYKVKSTTGSLSNVLNSYNNQTFQQTIVTEKETAISTYIELFLGKGLHVNKMTIDLDSPSDTHLYVYTKNLVDINNNTVEYIPLPGYENGNKVSTTMSYDFPNSSTAIALCVIMTKLKADNIITANNATTYEYVFGVRNISFYSNHYNTSSTLVSAPLDVPSNITASQISLGVDSEIPNGTSINYYVAPYSQTPNWLPISATGDESPRYDTIIDFSNINSVTHVFNISSDVSINERLLPTLKTNGINFYRLGNISTEQDIISGSEKLYRGRNNWKVEALNVTTTPTTTQQLISWITTNHNKSDISFYAIEDSKSNLIQLSNLPASNLIYKLSCYVICENQEIITTQWGSNCMYVAYVNNELVSGNSLKFKAGENLLQIWVYKPSTASSFYINIGTPILTSTRKIYTDNKPMTLVGLLDLQQRIASTSRDEYAITTINNTHVLVLNHYYQNLDYEFVYKYATNTAASKLLFKAELRRDSNTTDISPKLKSYIINFA